MSDGDVTAEIRRRMLMSTIDTYALLTPPRMDANEDAALQRFLAHNLDDEAFEALFGKVPGLGLASDTPVTASDGVAADDGISNKR